MNLVPLECLKAGEAGRIFDVTGTDSVITRLAEIGLREGATVRMVKSGSPCILALNDQRLSYRAEVDTQVYVEVLPLEKAVSP